MRAIGAIEFGGPDRLQVLSMPLPLPGPGEVRIRVHGAPVVPVDVSLRAGAFQGIAPLHPPYIPGAQAAGIVSALGPGASWKIGDRVMALVNFLGPDGGAYADEIVVAGDEIARIPDGASLFQASTLPMDGLTARAVLDLLDLAPGQTLAVTGAPGVVGGYVVQLAKDEGLRVIADASPADEHIVRALGADEVVRRGDDVAAEIRKRVPQGVDAVADAAVLHEAIVPAVRDGGKIASLRPFEGTLTRGVTAQFVVVPRTGNAARLDRLRELVEKEVLTLRVKAVLPAERAADAHRRLEAGGVRGRLVLDFS